MRYKRAEGIPGFRRPGPLQTERWMRAPGPMALDARRRFGPTFQLNVEPWWPWIMVSSPGDVKRVYGLKPDEVKSAAAVLRTTFGKESVLLLGGPEHMERRNLHWSWFRGPRLSDLQPVIEQVISEVLDELPLGTEFAFRPYAQKITLRVILSLLFGARAEEHEALLAGKVLDVLDNVSGPSMLAAALLGGGNPLVAKMRDRRAALDTVIAHIIDEVRAGHYDNCMVSALGARLDDEQLHDELVSLLLSGYESTAQAMAWAVERIARNEVGDLTDTEYADAVVHEVLRCRPVLHDTPRRLLVDLPLENGLVAPAGSNITVSVYLVHHDPAVYDDPFEFRPERFLGRPVPPNAWIPFGGGVRMCLGKHLAMLELTTLMQQIGERFTVSASGHGEKPRRRNVTSGPHRRGEIVLGDR